MKKQYVFVKSVYKKYGLLQMFFNDINGKLPKAPPSGEVSHS